MAKKSQKSKYGDLKTVVIEYRDAVNNRRGVRSSSTPASKETNGLKGLTTIQVNELLTITRTAKSLNKHVVLEANGDNLDIMLVDQYPPLPIAFYFYGD